MRTSGHNAPFRLSGTSLKLRNTFCKRVGGDQAQTLYAVCRHEDSFWNEHIDSFPDPYERADDQVTTWLPMQGGNGRNSNVELNPLIGPSLQMVARCANDIWSFSTSWARQRTQWAGALLSYVRSTLSAIDPSDFSPQAASEMASRASMPFMVDMLREAIESDWSAYAFLVCSTEDEHLVVRLGNIQAHICGLEYYTQRSCAAGAL